MANSYRELCAELVEAIEDDDFFRPTDPNNDALRFCKAVLSARTALAQPEPEGPTVMEIIELHTWLEDEWRTNNDGEDLPTLDFARAVLARWGRPTPQPVAVSERLPGPEDCLDEGWAWFFNQRIGWRQAVLPVSPGYTHWLPANALPTPEGTNG